MNHKMRDEWNRVGSKEPAQRDEIRWIGSAKRSVMLITSGRSHHLNLSQAGSWKDQPWKTKLSYRSISLHFAYKRSHQIGNNSDSCISGRLNMFFHNYMIECVRSNTFWVLNHYLNVPKLFYRKILIAITKRLDCRLINRYNHYDTAHTLHTYIYGKILHIF